MLPPEASAKLIPVVEPPAVTLIGVPPIAANATSSVTQFPGYVTSTLAYWKDIRTFWRGALTTDFKKLVEDAGFKDVRSGFQDATPHAQKGGQAFRDKSKGVHVSWFIVSGVK